MGAYGDHLAFVSPPRRSMTVMKNRKAILATPGSMVFEESEMPVPGPGEVLIKIGYVGICGSDIHAFESGPFIPPKDPAMKIGLGHECSGVVVGLGPGAEAFCEGDRGHDRTWRALREMPLLQGRQV